MAVEAAEPSQQATGGPIFVVGAMGSGTTLLRLILDSHEHIAIAQETGFMRAVVAHKWIPFWKFGGEWYGRLNWTEDELNRHLREFYDDMFQRFARQQGKRRWGDKTPYHTWHMQEAARVFPDAVFVATVRHPGAVASSVHNRFNYNWPKSVGHWMRSNMELAHRAGDLGDRFLLCRYEDLVLEPEVTLREVLEWLNEPWSPRVLEHNVVHSERGTPGKVEGRTRASDPIDAARISKWTETMDGEGYQLLRKRAAPLAGLFGYDIDDPTSLAPLLPPASPRQKVMTGTELAQRQASFSDTVDWSFRPQPSMANRQLQPKKLTVEAVAPKKQGRKQQKTNGGLKGNAEPKGSISHTSAKPTRRAFSGRSLARAVIRRLPALVRVSVRRLLDIRSRSARGHRRRSSV